jgi:hypothetical protein
MQLMKTIALSGLAALLAAGCGGAAVPAGQLTDAKASIRAAEEVGAGTTPRAALHLKMARDQVAEAEALMSDGEGEAAWYALRRAEADAELALALSREREMRQKAIQAKAKINELQLRAE